MGMEESHTEVSGGGTAGGVKLIHGDCLEHMRSMPAGSVDAVITDPPYPDYHTDKYAQTSIAALDELDCRQLIFWSARAQFPLDYTAIHIWDKVVGIGVGYERIFERNGQKGCRVYRHISPSSSVRARVGRDTVTGHPSQKPISLMLVLIEKYTKRGDAILDPFMGSGTTGVACINLKRKFIGIEIDETYFEIAQKRIKDASAQLRLEI